MYNSAPWLARKTIITRVPEANWKASSWPLDYSAAAQENYTPGEKTENIDALIASIIVEQISLSCSL